MNKKNKAKKNLKETHKNKTKGKKKRIKKETNHLCHLLGATFL